MSGKCEHPISRQYTGWYKFPEGAKPDKRAMREHLWVMCCECGEQLKAPELAVREEREWERQREERASA